MNQEIKAKWLEALRSGKYEQGRYALRTEDNKYCCLGVLCDVMGMKWERSEANLRWGAYNDPDGPYRVFESGMLPRAISKQCGLDDPNPDVRTIDGRHLLLSELNDGEATFEEIANLIEEQL